MVKYKCFKVECPVCGNSGSLQLFINKQNEVKYGRVRHIIHKGETGYNPNLKYNFHYCKIEDLQQLETLLKSLSLKFPTSTTQLDTAIADTNLKPPGQVGQDFMGNQAKLGQADLSLISKIKGAGSSARIEHHPPKVGVVGSNPTPPVCDIARAVHICYLRFLDISRLLVFRVSRRIRQEGVLYFAGIRLGFFGFDVVFYKHYFVNRNT
jgi:hypothetical protein